MAALASRATIGIKMNSRWIITIPPGGSVVGVRSDARKDIAKDNHAPGKTPRSRPPGYGNAGLPLSAYSRMRDVEFPVSPRPPARCRFVPRKLAVKGLPGAKRRDAPRTRPQGAPL